MNAPTVSLNKRATINECCLSFNMCNANGVTHFFFSRNVWIQVGFVSPCQCDPAWNNLRFSPCFDRKKKTECASVFQLQLVDGSFSHVRMSHVIFGFIFTCVFSARNLEG